MNKPQRQNGGFFRDALGALGLYYLADNIFGCLVAVIVVPIFLICFIGLIAYDYWTEWKEDEERAIAKTEEVLTKASDLIQRDARAIGRPLYQDEGNSRLRHSHDDGWRNPVTYELIDDGSFLIRSNGKDGRRNTDDDMTLQRRFEISKEKPST